MEVSIEGIQHPLVIFLDLGTVHDKNVTLEDCNEQSEIVE